MLRLRPLCLALLWSAPIAAQELAPDLQRSVLAVQPRAYEDPVCDAKPGHFRVGGAATYIETALNNSTNRARLLSDSRRVVIEAIADDDQAGNPGAWYILGRVYLYEVDMQGADSALHQVVVLEPGCQEEVTILRRNTWVAIRNYAVGEMQRGQVDSALNTYRAGLAIFQGEADVYYVMADIQGEAESPDSVTYYLRLALAVDDTTENGKRVRRNAVRKMSRIYAEAGEVDSAVAYYRLVGQEGEAAGDSNAVRSAESQIARVYFNGKRYPEALAAFRVLEAKAPKDATIKRNIATVFQAMGEVDSAQAVMASLGGGGGAAQMDTTSATFLINRGVSRFQSQNLPGAASDFRKALEVDPSNRLAMINLGYAYNSMQDGPRLVETAKKWMAREPLHELAYNMLIQGYVYEKDPAVQGVANQLDALPITIDTLNIQNAPGLMTITGVAFGRGRASPAVNLTFEFLGAGDAVLTTVDVTIPAMAPDGRAELVAQGEVDDIVNWRYRVR
jgi:tetratricopeptide (TPR) repeat protein